MRAITYVLLATLVSPAVALAVGEEHPTTARLVSSVPLGVSRFAPKTPTVVNPLAIYSNVTTFSGSNYANDGTANQAGNEISRLVADDTTFTTLPGVSNVTGFSFSVSNVNGVAVSARPLVRFYRADGASLGAGLPNAPGTLIVGYNVSPISFPAGTVALYNASALSPGFPVVAGGTETIWCGITFDNNTGGTGATQAQLNNLGQGIWGPVDLGSSVDIMFQTTAAGSFLANNPAGAGANFGGVAIANFGWELTVTTLPVELQSFTAD